MSRLSIGVKIHIGVLTTAVVTLILSQTVAPIFTQVDSGGWLSWLLALFAASGIGYGVRRWATASMARLQEELVHCAKGLALDLKTPLPEEGECEVAELARHYNQITRKVQHILGDVRAFSQELQASSQQAHHVVQGASGAVESQSAETERLSQYLKDMTITVERVSKNASEAAEAAVQANQQAQEGQSVVAKTMDVINSLSSDVSRAAEVIQKLAHDSESIGAVLDVIRGIADQTNLLALNAAIEAARAGEQGRGFAVVADEVRTLAQRTQESTQEIQQMIEHLQSGASDAVRVMEEGRNSAGAGVQQAAKAGASLETITRSVSRITEINREIVSSTSYQTETSRKINTNVETMLEGVSRMAHAIEEVRKNGLVWNQMVMRLVDTLEGVKIS